MIIWRLSSLDQHLKQHEISSFVTLALVSTYSPFSYYESWDSPSVIAGQRAAFGRHTSAVRFRNAQAFAGKKSGVHVKKVSSILRKVKDVAQGYSGREV